MSLFLSGFLLKGSQKLNCQLLTCLFTADNKGINYFHNNTGLLLFLIALGLRLPCFIYMEEGKEFSIHHPITYVSGLFKGPQINLAALTKEAYAIYMVARKLDYYLREAETTIRSDHLPLKSFLLKNAKNDKVNNWGVELASKYTLNFEYVKGIKNTLADTMSRLVTLDPDITLDKEPEGYQFGKQVESDVTEAEVKLVSLAPVASAPLLTKDFKLTVPDL